MDTTLVFPESKLFVGSLQHGRSRRRGRSLFVVARRSRLRQGMEDLDSVCLDVSLPSCTAIVSSELIRRLQLGRGMIAYAASLASNTLYVYLPFATVRYIAEFTVRKTLEPQR